MVSRTYTSMELGHRVEIEGSLDLSSWLTMWVRFMLMRNSLSKEMVGVPEEDTQGCSLMSSCT